jgi:uncharacterized protein
MKSHSGLWRRISRSIAALVFFCLGCRPTTAGDTLVIGERHVIDSKILNEPRRYFVHTPDRYHHTAERYPVLVVLDPDSQFRYAVAATESLAATRRIPPLIVVGVANVDRERDLGPPGIGANASSAARGADKTLAFIADELLPRIDATYRTHPYRAVSGHSRGGFFAIYALQNRPEVFKGYLAASPSLPLDDEALVKGMDSFLAGRRDLRADLYLTLGNEGRNMWGAMSRFVGVLTDKAPRSLRWHFERHPHETHASNAMPSMYDGLQKLFDGWYVHDPMALCEHGGFACLKAHYAKISERMGYPVPVPATSVMDIGSASGLIFGLTRAGRLDEAESTLREALEMYPNDANLRVSAVAFYTSLKPDSPRALAHAREVLKFSPGNGAARRVLDANKVDIETIVPQVKPSSESLSRHVGKYIAAPNHLGEISFRDGTLYLTLDSGQFELRPQSETAFYVSNLDIRLVFMPDRRGHTRGMVSTVYGDTFTFDKVK